MQYLGTLDKKNGAGDENKAPTPEYWRNITSFATRIWNQQVRTTSKSERKQTRDDWEKLKQAVHMCHDDCLFFS